MDCLRFGGIFDWTESAEGAGGVKNDRDQGSIHWMGVCRRSFFHLRRVQRRSSVKNEWRGSSIHLMGVYPRSFFIRRSNGEKQC